MEYAGGKCPPQLLEYERTAMFKITKVLLPIIFIILFCIGCASVKKAQDYYNACVNDEACYAQMQNNGAAAVQVVRSVNAGGFNNLGESIAFNVVSLLSGVLLGRKVKSKKG